MIGRLFRRKQKQGAPLARLVRHHRIGVNVTGDAIETARNRLALGAGLFVLAFAAIGLRFVDLTVLRDGAEPGLAAAPGGSGTDADRAEIVDRNGVVLAMSIPTQSLFANARLVPEPDEAARKLAKVLVGSEVADLAAKLKSEKSFIWLKRNLTPREVQLVNALGIPGIDFQREDRRVYPEGDLVSHVVGYAGIDNVGLAGVEQFFDAGLRNGDPVTLSIDVRLQRIVRQEIEFAMKKFDAVGAAGIVLDVRTGEILAMVSVPGFDPNFARTINDDSRFNRVTLGVYEMGSTFKLFNTAMALDSGKFNMNSSINASAPLQIDKFTIHDDHPQSRWLSLPEVIKFSSNIGSAKIADDVGIEAQRAFFEKIGFLKSVKVELPESASPLYPNPWRRINVLTISFGHGIAVTPLHLAMGVGGEVNNGVLVQPTLLRRVGPPPEGQRIISANTSRQLRQLMRLVVEEGTGKNAEVAGYVTGGKTGTSEKVGAHGGYRKKSLLSTFVGAFPMTDPRYVILVSIDEPKGNKESFGYATAGWVAAPAFGKIVQRMAALYLIPPVNDPTAILPSLAAPKKPPVAPVATPKINQEAPLLRLTELMRHLPAAPVVIPPGANPDILGLTADSRAVQPGYLFAALPGSKIDGARFMGEATQRGAIAALLGQATRVEGAQPATLIYDANPRRALALFAAGFYGVQPRRVVGVTGTSGKSSVAHFTREIWQRLGLKAASLGTLGLVAPGMDRAGSLTTPDAVALHADLAALAQAGIDHLVLEASSHGLDQFRLDGISFAAAAFTNLSREHLDYHPSMAAYFDAKSRLFAELLPQGGAAVINADTEQTQALFAIAARRGLRTIGFGHNAKEIRLLDSRATAHGQHIALEIFGRKVEAELNLVGDFQVANVMAALGLVLSETVDLDAVLAALPQLAGAPGRLQFIGSTGEGAAVYVDYAHKPDALETVLKVMRPHTTGRLVVVFGCGGDRDRGKRPTMGAIAARLADDVIVTDDNPRSENPATIRAAILQGADSAKNVREVADRHDAIDQAVAGLRRGDVLLIAGKGHEQGQIVGDHVLPFDDASVARAALKAGGV